MKPAHPREILRRTTRKPDLFIDQVVSIRLANGSHYQGKWQACDGETFQLIMRDTMNGSIIWLDAHALESIAFPNASPDMLSVLSGRTFDPYSNAEKVGELALSKQIATTFEALNMLIGKNIPIEAKSVSSVENPIASHVFIDLLRLTEKSFENICVDDFAKAEVAKQISQIKMKPSALNSVEIKDGVMTVEFSWEKPELRWRESDLTEAINKKL